MLNKYKELNGLELNGFKPYFKQRVVNDQGIKETLIFLCKGNHRDGFKEVRALLSQVEWLCAIEHTDVKDYKLTDLDKLADNIITQLKTQAL